MDADVLQVCLTVKTYMFSEYLGLQKLPGAMCLSLSLPCCSDGAVGEVRWYSGNDPNLVVKRPDKSCSLAYFV